METRFIVAVGKVEKDGYTVKSQEHLPPGQQVFIVTELDAEAVYHLAKILARMGEAEKAFQLLEDNEATVLSKYLCPYSEAIVLPLLVQGKIDKAFEIAKKIKEDLDHDLALFYVASYAINQGDLQKVTEIANYARDKQSWTKLLTWDIWLKRLKEVYDLEKLYHSLNQLLEVEGKD